jgi:VIT1/CCC1 family predicted Fe2+/Mn2+ transporter
MVPEEEKVEISQIFEEYGLSPEESAPVIEALSARPKAWVDFMMRFELGLEEPDPGRAVRSAATIAGAYIAGGLIPLSPYFLASNPSQALLESVAVTLVALAVFGYLKGKATGAPPLRNSVQTVGIGGLAAGAAFALAKLIA